MSSARLSNSVPVRTQTGRLATNWASRLGISSRIVLAGLLSLAVMLLAVAPPLFSQEAIGTIRGAVFDSTGAAIAGATVTVLDVARGTTRVLTTNAAGEYTAPALLVGLYSVRGEAKGFQTLERTNVNLDIGQDVRVDLTLPARRANPDHHGDLGSPVDRHHVRHPRRSRHQPIDSGLAPDQSQLSSITPTAPGRRRRAGRHRNRHRHQWPARRI